MRRDFAVAANGRFDGPHRSIEEHGWMSPLGPKQSKILAIFEKVIDLVFDTQPDGMTWVSVPMATGYGLVN